MRDADAEKAVSVGSDQPPAIVDSLGVEETGSFAFDIEETAVSIELLAVGCARRQQEYEAEDRGLYWMEDFHWIR